MHVIIKEREALLSTAYVSGQFLVSKAFALKMNCEEKHVKMDLTGSIGLPLVSVSFNSFHVVGGYY